MIKLDINNFIGLITFLGSLTVLILFKWRYDRHMKSIPTMDDLKETEARCLRADKELETKIDTRLNDNFIHMNKSLENLQTGQRDMMKLLIEHLNRQS